MTRKKRQLTVNVVRGKSNGHGSEGDVWIEADAYSGQVDCCYTYACKLFGPIREGQRKKFVLTAREAKG